MEFKKWVKIYQFKNVRSDIRRKVDFEFGQGNIIEFPKVKYRAKVKLDGTNACIRICNGEVRVQSRSRFITPEDDNYGFARWVHENIEWATNLGSNIKDVDVAVYGEWAGKGVQKRTSVAKVDRGFYPFAIVEGGTAIIEPASIYSRLDLGYADFVNSPRNCVVLPWVDDVEYFVDYGSAESLSLFLEQVNALCDQVERCDPFVRDRFGVEGLGEGVVLYPDTGMVQSLESCSSLMFKVKGEEHETVRQARPAVADPEVVNSINEFADKFLTPARLEQGVQEACSGKCDIKLTGHFLKWIGNDVKSESKAELEAAELKWKHVAKTVGTKARQWWMEKCRES